MLRSAPAVLGLVVLFGACAEPAPSGPQGDAEAVALVQALRDAHGSDRLDGATLRFQFRGDVFTTHRDGGRFRHARTTTDSLGREVVDVLDNGGLSRTVGGEPVALSEAEARRVETAVNSVVYFATLPYALTDPAVQARALGPDSVAGEPYDRLEVTFAQAGGGRDWEDRYLYWIHPERRTLDYLAYTYELAEGADGPHDTGHRFRRVIGVDEVGGADGEGVRIQSYENLTADSLGALEDYPAALAAGRTRPVSEVRTKYPTLE